MPSADAHPVTTFYSDIAIPLATYLHPSVTSPKTKLFRYFQYLGIERSVEERFVFHEREAESILETDCKRMSD